MATSLITGYMQSEAAKAAAEQQAQAANNATDAQMRIFNTLNAQGLPYREAGVSALGMLSTGLGLKPAQKPADNFSAATPEQLSPDQRTAYEGWARSTQSNIDNQIGPPTEISVPNWMQSTGQKPPPTQGTQDQPDGGMPSGFLTQQFSAPDMYLSPNYQFMLNQGLGQTANFMNSRGGLQSGNTMRGLVDYSVGAAGQGYGQAYDIFSSQQTNIFNRLASIAGLGQTANNTSAQAGASMSGGIANSMMNAGASAAAGRIGSANAIAGGLNNAGSWYALSQMSKSPSTDNTAVLGGE
jgi:hypothetical protein